MDKQVSKGHYEFARYMTEARWATIWHQLDEVIKLSPTRVLEIGPGPGIFKAAANAFGVHVETMDIDPDLNPDYVSSVFAMPFASNEIDVVCAFQMLEHLPYEQALQAFSEMVRVAKKSIVISLPDAKKAWPMQISIPKIGKLKFLISLPYSSPKEHKFDGEHYWEINKKYYELRRIIDDFERSNCKLAYTYRTWGSPFHRFFVYHKTTM